MGIGGKIELWKALERMVGAQLAEFNFTALAQRAKRPGDEFEAFRVEAAAEASRRRVGRKCLS